MEWRSSNTALIQASIIKSAVIVRRESLRLTVAWLLVALNREMHFFDGLVTSLKLESEPDDGTALTKPWEQQRPSKKVSRNGSRSGYPNGGQTS